MAEKSEDAPDPPPSNRLTRSARLVMGAGIFAAAAMTTASRVFIRHYQNHDEVVVFFIGLLIGIVFCAWSILLSFRAIKQGEREGPATTQLGIASSMVIALLYIFLANSH